MKTLPVPPLCEALGTALGTGTSQPMSFKAMSSGACQDLPLSFVFASPGFKVVPGFWGGDRTSSLCILVPVLGCSGWVLWGAHEGVPSPVLLLSHPGSAWEGEPEQEAAPPLFGSPQVFRLRQPLICIRRGCPEPSLLPGTDKAAPRRVGSWRCRRSCAGHQHATSIAPWPPPGPPAGPTDPQAVPIDPQAVPINPLVVPIWPRLWGLGSPQTPPGKISLRQ